MLDEPQGGADSTEDEAGIKLPAETIEDLDPPEDAQEEAKGGQWWTKVEDPG